MTSSYIPASAHYLVDMYSAPGTEIVVEYTEHCIRVDGVDIGLQGAHGACVPERCIRLALSHVEPETDWSDGGEAWEGVSWESRTGALATCVDYSDVGEDAESWYDALGHTTTVEVDGDDREGSHPVCSIDEVPTYSPGDALERDLLDYAVDAREAALSIRASIDEAIEAHRSRDVDGVVSALAEAMRVEREYGDEPSTRAAAKALLGQGWSLRYDHISRWSLAYEA